MASQFRALFDQHREGYLIKKIDFVLRFFAWKTKVRQTNNNKGWGHYVGERA